MVWLEDAELSPGAAGPFDRWLTPRRELFWRVGDRAIDGPVAKLGGQPFWLDEPFWPVSGTSGAAMTFVGQFPLPGPDTRMAYLFLSDEDGTFLAEGWENALLVQPGGRVPGFVRGEARRSGPSLWRRGASWEDRVPAELSLDLRDPDPADAAAFERAAAFQRAARGGLPEPDDDAYVEWRSYVGGEPILWQPWTSEVLDDSWRFFFQLDGSDGWGGNPFTLNFGGGTGYAFLSEDLREGRFYWDCV
ncbi:hypothetical protein ACWT_4021 [Actinoplanes sp. SE50]|uniref:hypothetical protein n=1 Tax=unclassified Actinoplanes TaxID=2626549 RepID=UPI00023EBBA8|nr:MULTISPECIES: hypothetical protein [unclassified Actinoplanes]AEV85045.1 hypothetical protein ACPL_4150 [Actinoplanes sp. SE50/110]ATO83436.1 hypothetical protein ACWT_4021 [Actinoplanes sp. SE50]SLM00843.1 hypothetical protein ACSP50_4076 [Actinoplanes sp. SE50/110]